MKCTVTGCPGEYSERRVNQTYRVERELIVISEIPVECCSVCGDVLLTPETAEKIEQLLRNHGPADTAAPVYRLVG